MASRVPVTFTPAGVTVWVDEGVTVLDAARRAGVLIPATCGGRGICGSCGVRVREGSLAPPDDLERVGLARAPAGVRFACRARVSSPVTVSPIVARTISSSSAEVVTDENLVAGVDLGTTGVSAVIVGSASGREIGRASVPNAQQTWGADVLTRISAALSGSADELRRSAEESVIEALSGACGRAGVCLAGLERVVVVANTAMTSLLAGVDVKSLATAPFDVPAGIPRLLTSGAIVAKLPADCEILLVPAIAAFVGGDAAADLLAAGMLDAGDTAVLVDIGTNAEIAVASPLGLTVASAPAGPAFEGYGISCGGLLASGASTTFALRDGELDVAVDGGGEPLWLSGSGLVSLIALLRELGHITVDGLMVAEGPLAARFGEHDGIRAFFIGEADAAPFLLQTDVRAFQTAKAAVAAAIATSVKAARVKPRGISRFIVTGAFGGALELDWLIDLGVIPEDLGAVTEFLADAALLGAAQMAFDLELETRLDAAIAGSHHVELATDPAFTGAFVEHTRLEPFKLKHGLFS